MELKKCLKLRRLTLRSCARSAARALTFDKFSEEYSMARYLVMVDNIRHYLCSYHWQFINDDEECFQRKYNEVNCMLSKKVSYM